MVSGLYAETADSWGTDSDDGNITVGDTGAVDTYFTDTLLAPCATDVSGVMRSNALSPLHPKFYDTGATISATFPFGTTAVVTGLTRFVLVWAPAR
jgi:hypothetical protein